MNLILINFSRSDRLLHQRAEMVEVSGSCDGAAEEGDALANMSVCAAHDGDGRADGGQNRHDELNDVLNGFLFHGVKIKGFLFLVSSRQDVKIFLCKS